MEKKPMATNLKITDEIITSKIFIIREQKVMLDSDLAKLYEVETKRLKEQVKRNLPDFLKILCFNSLTMNGIF